MPQVFALPTLAMFHDEVVPGGVGRGLQLGLHHLPGGRPWSQESGGRGRGSDAHHSGAEVGGPGYVSNGTNKTNEKQVKTRYELWLCAFFLADLFVFLALSP